jgi:hypothetical protein
MSLANGAYI